MDQTVSNDRRTTERSSPLDAVSRQKSAINRWSVSGQSVGAPIRMVEIQGAALSGLHADIRLVRAEFLLNDDTRHRCDF
ncbi:MAG: hypothetical protein CMN92_00290 [Synechococcus sp. CPC100]|nr:hypothetical protein [Synechococcus sp. CPC100]